jgi:hypothetical protein
MMETDGIHVDASRCYALFRRLNTKNQRKVSRAALRGAANKLKKEAVKNLQQVIGHSVRKTTTYTRANGKTDKRSLAKGVRVVVSGPDEAKVHIMGDYRLKWFEMGAGLKEPRKTKGVRRKGKKIPLRRSSNRGKVFKDTSKLGWFAKAVNAKEPEAARDIENELVKHIQKQANRDGITLN